MNDQIRAAELGQRFAAEAARRCRRLGVGDYGHGVEAASSGGHRGSDRRALGAERQSERPIFDVAADEDTAVLREQGGADLEAGKRRIGLSTGGSCRLDQPVADHELRG